MKKVSFLFALMFVATTVFGQAEKALNVQNQAIDQYGNKVDVKDLSTTSRDGILVFESKNKDYKFWFDARVQVDFGAFFGEQEWADPIG
ncbi:MAG: hypothetical protein MJZ78_05460, partial [Bacteroidales bacterium]|nr:hypothetical protein [Bacteroidales bacterium]